MELAITILIIAILVSIAIPLYRPVHQRAMHQTVQANLRIINGSIQQYIADHNVPRIDVDATDLTPDYLTDWPSGPGQASYSLVSGWAVLATPPWSDYDPAAFD